MINIIKQDILFLSMWLNISEMGGGCSIGASISGDPVMLLCSALLLMHYYAVLYRTVLYYWRKI